MSILSFRVYLYTDRNMYPLSILTKTALQRENAGILSKATADTVGQVGGLLSLNPAATRDLSTLRKSNSPEQHELVDAVAKLDDPSLRDVVVRPGGYNLIKDVPRLFTNKRTSLLGKLFGAGRFTTC